MVVDTSAVVALLLGEDAAERIDELLGGSEHCAMSAATLVELMIVVEARTGPAGVVIATRLLNRFGIEVAPLTEEVAQHALDGWRRFGRGRHPAGLNLGDAYSYGLAVARAEPLLFVGDDFARTDVQPALVG